MLVGFGILAPRGPGVGIQKLTKLFHFSTLVQYVDMGIKQTGVISRIQIYCYFGDLTSLTVETVVFCYYEKVLKNVNIMCISDVTSQLHVLL